MADVGKLEGHEAGQLFGGDPPTFSKLALFVFRFWIRTHNASLP